MVSLIIHREADGWFDEGFEGPLSHPRMDRVLDDNRALANQDALGGLGRGWVLDDGICETIIAAGQLAQPV